MLLFAGIFFILPVMATVDPSSAEYFINYNGSFSGSYTVRGGPSNCGTFYFDNISNSLLHVGPPPSWDPNPFALEIKHDGNGQSNTNDSAIRRWMKPKNNEPLAKRWRGGSGLESRKRDFCPSVGGCTDDPIYNLDFTSLWKNIYGGNPEPFILLNRSSVTVVNSGPGLSVMGGLPYYSVSGDKTTLNASLIATSEYQGYGEEFNFQIPRNYTESQDEHTPCLVGYFNWQAHCQQPHAG